MKRILTGFMLVSFALQATNAQEGNKKQWSKKTKAIVAGTAGAVALGGAAYVYYTKPFAKTPAKSAPNTPSTENASSPEISKTGLIATGIIGLLGSAIALKKGKVQLPTALKLRVAKYTKQTETLKPAADGNSMAPKQKNLPDLKAIQEQQLFIATTRGQINSIKRELLSARTKLEKAQAEEKATLQKEIDKLEEQIANLENSMIPRQKTLADLVKEYQDTVDAIEQASEKQAAIQEEFDLCNDADKRLEQTELFLDGYNKRLLFEKEAALENAAKNKLLKDVFRRQTTKLLNDESAQLAEKIEESIIRYPF